MSQSVKNSDQEMDSKKSGGNVITLRDIWGSVTSLDIGGIPIPTGVLHRAAKAISYLGIIPKSYIDGQALVMSAKYEARANLIKTCGELVAKNASIDPELATAALENELHRLVGRRLNIGKATQTAMEELSGKPLQKQSAQLPDETQKPQDSDISISSQEKNADQSIDAGQQGEINDIDVDWLNTFSDAAACFGSDYMSKVFGKILAGEIRNPGSFSIRTLKIVAQLDKNVAELFVKLCQLSLVLRGTDGKCFDARMITLGRDPNQADAFAEFGIRYWDLVLLQEYGLISSVENSAATYTASIYRGDRFIGVRYADKRAGFIQKEGTRVEELRLAGIMLGAAGRELVDVVSMVSNPNYTKALNQYLDALGVKFLIID